MYGSASFARESAPGGNGLGERPQHEFPLGDALMRHLEPALLISLLAAFALARVEDKLVVQQHVEVDHAWPVAERAEVATKRLFDGLACLQELSRRKGRLDLVG